MTRAEIRGVVDTVIRNHPKDCVFVPNVVDSIMLSLSDSECEGPVDKLVSLLEDGIYDREIYCPHEGIDRRAEFGLEGGK